VVAWIESELSTQSCTGPANPGRVTMRRLNRAEYNNTVRDLIGLDLRPADDFPNDDVGYGFDNIGDVLSLSPLLFERYLGAAEAVLDHAIVSEEPPQPTKNRLGGIRIVPPTAGDTRRGFGQYLRGAGAFANVAFTEAGDYTIRVEVFGQAAGGEPIRLAVRVDGEPLQSFEVKGTRTAPEFLEVKTRLTAGSHRFAVGFLNPSADPKPADFDKQRLLILRGLTLDGPYHPPPVEVPASHRRIMAHRDGLSPREAAREIVGRFSTKAFRRPVKPEEVERILTVYDRAQKEGEKFDGCVRFALARVLVSPHFLFRVERDPPGVAPGQPYPVGEYELASRLSYFLWSTMPDEELFTLAGRGQLRQNLDAQVRRMLADPKSGEFVRNFADQWLTLRSLANVNPDPKTFPNFDPALRAAMLRETEMFFEAVVREDRSILDLLDADFSFVNERLARHYGIPGVKGPEFRRVKLPPNRGGILTQASILTLTSNSTRTSPVKRGKWVLDQILNAPPPPPPPDVPPLEEGHELKGTLRQVMEQHRSNALCASCHAKLDPLGFAFENYDAVGAWRDKEGSHAIDASGTLPDGQSFTGAAGLKAILKGKKESFGRCLTEKVLTYALGRGLEYYDRCAVDKMVAELDKGGYRFSALLSAVVHSEPFQQRTATGNKP
jgi:hypothetical protein